MSKDFAIARGDKNIVTKPRLRNQRNQVHELLRELDQKEDLLEEAVQDTRRATERAVRAEAEVAKLHQALFVAEAKAVKARAVSDTALELVSKVVASQDTNLTLDSRLLIARLNLISVSDEARLRAQKSGRRLSELLLPLEPERQEELLDLLEYFLNYSQLFKSYRSFEPHIVIAAFYQLENLKHENPVDEEAIDAIYDKLDSYLPLSGDVVNVFYEKVERLFHLCAKLNFDSPTRRASPEHEIFEVARDIMEYNVRGFEKQNDDDFATYCMSRLMPWPVKPTSL